MLKPCLLLWASGNHRYIKFAVNRIKVNLENHNFGHFDIMLDTLRVCLLELGFLGVE